MSPQPGAHSLTVRATDAEGAASLSAPVQITVRLIQPAPYDQDAPAVASDGTNFFVVWQDQRNRHGAWTEHEIVGARVSASGQVLDANGIIICTTTNTQWSQKMRPEAAFDGVNYFVVWYDDRDHYNEPAIYGARISTSGSVLDRDGFRIGFADPWMQTDAALAFNGTDYLVVWNDWRNYQQSICDIYGSRVSTAGVVYDPAGLPIIVKPLWQTSASIASLGGDFLVAWQDNDGVRGTRVNRDGVVLDQQTIKFNGPSGGGLISAMAASAVNYLVVWVEDHAAPGNTVIQDLYSTRVSASGALLDNPPLAVTAAPGYDWHPAVAATRLDFMVVWENGAGDWDSKDVYGAKVSGAGLVSQRFPISLQPHEQGEPAIAFNGSRFLVVWRDARNTADSPGPFSGSYDVYGTFLTVTGEVLDTNGFLISTVAQETPVLTWPGPADIVYGTPLGSAQLNATANVPGTFVYAPPAGTILKTGQGHVLTTTFTPLDTANFNTATLSVTINVRPAQLTIRADNKTKLQGAPNPPLTATYSGFVAGATPASLDVPVVLTTTATTSSPPGQYPIIASDASDANYAITHQNGALTVLHSGSQPGALDLNFDPGSGADDAVSAIALQPDGKVIIGGPFTTFNGVPRHRIARLNANGSLDLSFNPGQGADYNVYAAAVQADGKVLIAGGFNSVNGMPRTHLARLNSDGSLDTGFNPHLDLWVIALAVQPDGKIVIGGYFTTVNGVTRHRVARLGADGSLDISFAPAPGADPMHVTCVAVQSDGKIVLGGVFERVNGVARSRIARLNADGSLDTGFDPGFGPDSTVNSVALQPDGKVVLGGHFANINGITRRGIARLNADGSLDTAFDPSTGMDHADAPAVHALAIQPDGKVLTAGWFERVNGAPRTHLARLNPDGSLDETFAADIEVSGWGSGLQAVVLQPDGKVLIAGSLTAVNGVWRKGIARLNNDIVVPTPFVQREIAARGNIRLAASPGAQVSVYAIEDQPPTGWPVENISHDGVFDSVTGKVKFGPFFDSEPRTLSYSVLIPPGCVHGVCGLLKFSGTASTDGVNTPIIGNSVMLIAGLHPADLNPADSQLSIGEVTAYGAAWRRGENWSVAPNPIPIDFVTRAGALWRGGECYEVDLAAPNAPLCWVNCSDLQIHGAFVKAATALPVEPLVARQAPPVFVPGEPITVTITTTPAAEAKAYAVEDQFPANWTVSAISDGGELDAVNGKVKWGPFLDSNSRTLSYRVAPPASASGLAAFLGVASFDGTSAAIGGTRQLRAGCRLTAMSLPRGDRFALTVGGELGRRYVIEASTDLITWTPLVVVTNTLGRVEFSDSAWRIHKQRFYRAMYHGP
jgi:uncharacterized delta-60 repeat protein